MALCMPVGAENMTPVQVALWVARHTLVTLNGLLVTDIPDAETTWTIDTGEEIKLIDQALNELGDEELPDQSASIADKLDKIVEQLELANAMGIAASLNSKLEVDYQWKDMDDGEISGDDAPEKVRKQRLIPRALYRILDDE